MSRAPASRFLLAAALLVGVGSYLVRPAGARQANPAVANVDMARVVADSDARRASTAKLQAFANKIADRFDETARLQYLKMAEIEQYSAALNADAPTDVQKQTMETLKAEAAKRADEAQKLMSKKDPDLTPADRARLRELTGIEQQRPQALDSLRRLYQGVAQQEDARLARETQAQVREVVTKLAREQGVTQVFDTSSLVVAPLDLTQQALARVKKK